MMNVEGGREVCPPRIQINLEKPLKKFIYVQGRKQAIVYEALFRLRYGWEKGSGGAALGGDGGS